MQPKVCEGRRILAAGLPTRPSASQAFALPLKLVLPLALHLACSQRPVAALAAGIPILEVQRHDLAAHSWGVGRRAPSGASPALKGGAVRRLKMNNLPEWLRGGQGEGRGQGGFKTRVVPAAYARRPKVGIEIGETTAALIGAASVAIFSLSMPPVFSAAQARRPAPTRARRQRAAARQAGAPQWVLAPRAA
jgi:hypothetical protein